VVLLALTLVGCRPAAETPDADSEPPAQQAPERDTPPTRADAQAQPAPERVDPATLLDQAAHLLPDDVFLLAVLDVEVALHSSIVDAFTTRLDDDAIQTLKADLAAHFSKHLGLDPTGAEWVVLAVGDTGWGAAIVGGSIDISPLADAGV